MFLLDLFDGVQLPLDEVGETFVATNGRLALGTLGQLNEAGAFVRLEPTEHALDLDDMLAVLEQDEPSVGMIFGAEEDLGKLSAVAHAAQARTRLAAKAHARVAAPQAPPTRLLARLAIAQFVAETSASFVHARPRAPLHARRARLPTLVAAARVRASILAAYRARLTLLCARRATLVTAEQDTRALFRTVLVHSTFTCQVV